MTHSSSQASAVDPSPVSMKVSIRSHAGLPDTDVTLDVKVNDTNWVPVGTVNSKSSKSAEIEFSDGASKSLVPVTVLTPTSNGSTGYGGAPGRSPFTASL